MRSIRAIVLAGLVLGWGAPVVARAADEPAADPAAASTELQPVRAGAPSISFGGCHFEATPPHDPHTRLECPAGEVVVAVYESGVRCCSLELR